MRNIVLCALVAAMSLFVSCAVTHVLEEKQLTTELKHVPTQVVKEQQKQLSQEMYERFENPEKLDSTKMESSQISIFDKNNFKKDSKGDLVASVEAQEVTVVSRTRVLAERDGKVTVDFVITMPRELQSAASSVVITPMLHRSDSTLLLEPLQVRGGLFGLLQERNYWKYSSIRNNLMRQKKGEPLNAQDTMFLKKTFEEIVQYPYLDNTRFDSVARAREKITYYYTQRIEVKESESKLLLTLNGKVNALDGSVYVIPPRDTISFNLSTMLFFVDTTTRYVKRVVERFSEVKDRNYLSFKVGKSDIIDTLGNNKTQLNKIKSMMDQMLLQQEFYIDTIVLSAAASPEGYAKQNAKLASERAHSLEKYLKNHYQLPELDTLLQVRSIGENWRELRSLIDLDVNIKNIDKILEIIDGNDNIDEKEFAIRRKFNDDYKYIRQNLYPLLRTVDFKYNLRRIGMIKDTIHTTEVDTAYMNAVEMLKNRQYRQAAKVLLEYDDYNGLITALSLGFNDDAYEKAVKMTEKFPDDRIWYMRAIACARVGKFDEGLKYYKKAVEANDGWEFRGRLDPEISMLLFKDEKN